MKKIMMVVAVLGMAGAAQARDQVRIVGSSTVYPFSIAVAERLGRLGNQKIPVVESTGSGAGFKLFCASVGDNSADITNASRRMKASELENCRTNDVGAVAEIKIGYDGIVVARSAKHAPLALSRDQLYRALAKVVPIKGQLVANPYKTWKDVDQALPDEKIEVLGKPTTSGTRDAFVELVMDVACQNYPEIKAITDAKKQTAACQALREDGAYIEVGEDNNLIVQRLAATPTLVGIFGYSFLEQNPDRVQGSTIDGWQPSFENISSGDYPLSRPLYFYVKKAHIAAVPGIVAYVAEFSSEKAWGEEGYLADRGLIPMPDDERAAETLKARTLPDLVLP